MRTRLRFVPLSVALLLLGCTLEEITVVQVEAVVIAEIYANLDSDPAENEVRAFLHRTLGADTIGAGDLTETVITVRRSTGALELRLVENEIEDCLGSVAPDQTGVCFLADPALTRFLQPGDLLTVEVELPDGGSLNGAARVPSEFELAGVPAQCRLAPNTQLPLRWSRSDGAWAYVNETSIRGLPEALEPEGIVLTEDPLYLLGLSVSEADTTIVFPGQFGVFNRFDLEQDVALRLQIGLPASTTAEVTITAADRNFINWVRGGSFNPSGQVRVASLRGDGTGVFAASVNRRFVVLSGPAPGVQDCPVPSQD